MGLASILTIAAALAIRIASHRILQVFADGITETMNAADEEWEESRLISAVKECQDLCSPDSIAHIMRAADQFAAGAEQHDDMTLMVLRVKSR